MLMFTEFAIDSLFIYAMVIGSIVAIIFVYLRKKRSK
ncbi:EYxxD motif small membrane protein [Alkalihalobacillus sp. LMS39]